MLLAVDVILSKDSMSPFVVRAAFVEEKIVRVARGIQAPVALPLWVERLAGCDAFVNIAAKDEAVRQVRIQTHGGLNDAMKAAKLRER